MAEFLIKASSANWMDNTSKWTAKGVTQEKYDGRSQKGDIVEVRKDGATYGRLECPPQYVVIKVPELDAEKVKSILEQRVYDITTVDSREVQTLRRKHAYCVPTTLVDNAIKDKGVLELKQDDFIAYITKYSLSAQKNLATNTITSAELR